MKTLRQGAARNEQLELDRGVSFEQRAAAIEAGAIEDVLSHPNPPGSQRHEALFVAGDGCVCLVPFAGERDPSHMRAGAGMSSPGALALLPGAVPAAPAASLGRQARRWRACGRS